MLDTRTSPSRTSPTHYRLSARIAKHLQEIGGPASKETLASKVLSSSNIPEGKWIDSLMHDLIDGRFWTTDNEIGLWAWKYPFPASEEAIAVLDIETTGLSPSESEITELAIVRLENGKKEIFSELVNPGTPIPHFITKLTGITNDDVADADDIYSVLARAIPLLEGATLFIQNAPFDLGFLRPRLERLGYRLDNSVIDTIKWASKALPSLPKRGLDSLAWAFDIDKLENRHRALGDVETTLSVAREMYYLLTSGTEKPVNKI